MKGKSNHKNPNPLRVSARMKPFSVHNISGKQNKMGLNDPEEKNELLKESCLFRQQCVFN